MKLNTLSELRHHTTVINATRASVPEMVEEIRTTHSTGKMTVNFNQGGVTSITFEESETVSQQEVEERAQRLFNANGNGHAATRGSISVITS